MKYRFILSHWQKKFFHCSGFRQWQFSKGWGNLVRNSKTPRKNRSCTARSASMPLMLVLIQKHTEFYPVQCFITYSFSSAQDQAVKLDITIKCLKVFSHRSVLFCKADRPFTGYKHFKDDEQEEEAINGLCSFRWLYTFLFKLTKQIGSKKLVTAVGNKKTSACAPGCSFLVHLPHPDFV